MTSANLPLILGCCKLSESYHAANHADDYILTFPVDEPCHMQMISLSGVQNDDQAMTKSPIRLVRERLDSALTNSDLTRIAKSANDDNPLPDSPHLVAYSLWALEIQDGMFALLDAEQARSQHVDRSRLSSGTTGLSLLLHRNTAYQAATDPDESNLQPVLVQWVLGGRSGRIADIDADSRVIAIVPAGAKRVPLDFSGSEIIHPATGVFMERVKKRERPRLPVHIKRLMTMWRVGLQSDMPEHQGLQLLNQSEMLELGTSGAAQALAAGTSGCVFCGSHLAGSNNDFIQQCCVCLHHWHMSCSKLLIDCIRPVRTTDGDSETVLYSIEQHTGFGGDAAQNQQQQSFKHHVKVSNCEVPDRFRPRTDADRRTPWPLPYCFKVQNCDICIM